LILTSPVSRARETAELLQKGFGLTGASLKVLHALHYETPLRLAMTRLSHIKLHGTVYLVGHEPWLGNFLSLLLSGRRGRGFPMRKAGFAAVALEKPAPGQGRLIAFLPPECTSALSTSAAIP
jgi:phosphohistidine phosphatase